MQGLDFKEAPTQEDLRLDFKHEFQVMVEHKKILEETQASDVQTDT